MTAAERSTVAAVLASVRAELIVRLWHEVAPILTPDELRTIQGVLEGAADRLTRILRPQPPDCGGDATVSIRGRLDRLVKRAASVACPRCGFPGPEVRPCGGTGDEQLDAEVAQLERDIAELEADIARHKVEVAELEVKVAKEEAERAREGTSS